MEKEILTMHENEVWKLVDITENKTTGKCKCVFKVKYNQYGIIYKHRVSTKKATESSNLYLGYQLLPNFESGIERKKKTIKKGLKSTNSWSWRI